MNMSVHLKKDDEFCIKTKSPILLEIVAVSFKQYFYKVALLLSSREDSYPGAQMRASKFSAGGNPVTD